MSIRQVIARQKRQIRKDFKALAKLYPGCFDERGKPVVAVLSLPRPGAEPSTSTRTKS